MAYRHGTYSVPDARLTGRGRTARHVDARTATTVGEHFVDRGSRGAARKQGGSGDGRTGRTRGPRRPRRRRTGGTAGPGMVRRERRGLHGHRRVERRGPAQRPRGGGRGGRPGPRRHPGRRRHLPARRTAGGGERRPDPRCGPGPCRIPDRGPRPGGALRARRRPGRSPGAGDPHAAHAACLPDAGDPGRDGGAPAVRARTVAATPTRAYRLRERERVGDRAARHGPQRRGPRKAVAGPADLRRRLRRRPAARLLLRRRAARGHADRLHRLQFRRGRPGRLAPRGSARLHGGGPAHDVRPLGGHRPRRARRTADPRTVGTGRRERRRAVAGRTGSGRLARRVRRSPPAASGAAGPHGLLRPAARAHAADRRPGRGRRRHARPLWPVSTPPPGDLAHLAMPAPPAEGGSAGPLRQRP